MRDVPSRIPFEMRKGTPFGHLWGFRIYCGDFHDIEEMNKEKTIGELRDASIMIYFMLIPPPDWISFHNNSRSVVY